MIYLTAVGLPPGGSSTVHIYTQTIHGTTQSTQRIRLFEDVQDIQAAVTSSLQAIPQEDLQRYFQSLLDPATRCIGAEVMYFE